MTIQSHMNIELYTLFILDAQMFEKRLGVNYTNINPLKTINYCNQ